MFGELNSESKGQVKYKQRLKTDISMFFYLGHYQKMSSMCKVDLLTSLRAIKTIPHRHAHRPT